MDPVVRIGVVGVVDSNPELDVTHFRRTRIDPFAVDGSTTRPPWVIST